MGVVGGGGSLEIVLGPKFQIRKGSDKTSKNY